VTYGAWQARWANWVVHLEANEGGWDVKVWLWLPGKPATARRELAVASKMASHEEAVKWACQAMRDDGATVMVLDAPSITLESMLQFAPAPRAVA
jgi:hypothetical protein